MAHVILFPTDFSTASDAVLPHAEALAKQSHASLLIVHVEEPPLAYGTGELYYGLPEPSSERSGSSHWKASIPSAVRSST